MDWLVATSAIAQLLLEGNVCAECPALPDTNHSHRDLHGTGRPGPVSAEGETETMSETPHTRNVPVPGGAQDAGVFAALARALSDRFTVIALDPRCNSRSPCDDTATDLNVDQQADDAAAVIAAFGSGPVMVFGTSGGAQVGLNLAARHPELVSILVAHEPPSMMLMADPSVHLAADKALHDTYLRDGVQAAMAQFKTANGLDAGAMTMEMSAEDMETFGRMEGNFEYWLAHGMLPLSQYRADVKALKGGAPNIIVALGAESVGQPIYQMGTALAVALGVQPETFPGDHMGFGMDPVGFAAALGEVLASK